MIKTLRALFVKICGALPVVALIVCVMGGMSTDETAEIQPVRKTVNIHARPSKPEESDDIDSLRQRAEQGDIDAQNALGTIYHGGKGVLQDYAEAEKWYRLAAEKGDINAQLMLGGMYYSGEGILQNHAEAFKLYHCAAEQGDSRAQYVVGVMYIAGMGVPMSYKDAYVWFSIAAANGYDSTEIAKQVEKEHKEAGAATQRNVLAGKLLPADLSAAQAEAVSRHAAIQEKLQQNEKKD